RHPAFGQTPATWGRPSGSTASNPLDASEPVRTRNSSYLNVRLWNNDHVFFWGERSTSNGVHAVLQGDESRIVIGDDCMFANDIFIRNSDMHAVVDMRSGEWLNAGGNVHFEPHVWVAQEALILKNTMLGFGAIVGAKSIVNREVPRYAMVAGAPAKVVRRDVSWDREMRPGTDTVAKLREYECRVGQAPTPL
ncbi:MAG: acyltransferase, partial [Geminicoccaceae bacterium]